MKCFIIVIIDPEEGEEGKVLSTRKRFSTREEAQKYIDFYSDYWREKSHIIECPKGLEY